MMLNRYNFKEEAFASAVAETILSEAVQCISRKAKFKLVLSGGNTPIQIFEQLVKQQSKIDWSKVEIYWVDERCVSVDSLDSNYGCCKKKLIDHLDVKPNVYPMYRSGSPLESAKKYEQILKSKLMPEEIFKFDLILLGVGEDGHVASLFPNSDALNEKKHWIVVTSSPHHPHTRISMTFPLINASQKCLFIAKGKEKIGVLDSCQKQIINQSIPAAYVKPVSGQTDWFVVFE